MPKYKILAWETDSRLNPTGPERFFVSDSCRKVAKQIAYELGGESHGSMVYLPDGKKWGCRAYQKIK
jgi:hypothetical protein